MAKLLEAGNNRIRGCRDGAPLFCDPYFKWALNLREIYKLWKVRM